jgi:hypothetical protein
MEFVSASYWDIEGSFDPAASRRGWFNSDGKRIAQGRDFGPDAQLVREDAGSSPRAMRAPSPPRSRAPISLFARSRRSRIPAARPRRS